MKNKIYILLYYFSFIITLALTIMLYEITMNLIAVNTLSYILAFINLILVIIFTILLIRKKEFEFDNIIFPILYIIFAIFIIIVSVLYSKVLLIPILHLSYYYSILSFIYIFLNIYTILCKKE